jgi:hypothetical protein
MASSSVNKKRAPAQDAEAAQLSSLKPLHKRRRRAEVAALDHLHSAIDNVDEPSPPRSPVNSDNTAPQ